MRDYLDERPIKLSGNTPRRPFALALLLCVLAIALLVMDRRGLLAPIHGVVDQAFSPAAQYLTALRDNVIGFWAGVGNVQQLRAENAQLKQQVSQLQENLVEREQVLAENTRLRKQLAIENEHPWRLLGSDVVVRSPDAGRRVITIARGSKDGIKPGMAVVGQNSSGPTALVGIVEDTGLHTANVLLITDFGSQISARVLHAGQAALGLARGQWQRGSRLRLEQIERGATLVAGDIVVSAGLTQELNLNLALTRVPSGIPIGTIETISSDGHVPVAELRPYVDPDQVHYVWVILNQGD